MAEREQDDAAQAQDPAQELETQETDVGVGSQNDMRTFQPSVVETNRSRMQGGGVGATELDQQRDPTTFQSADQYGRDTDQGDENA